MKYYWKNNGFYDYEVKDGIEITIELHQKLLEGQSKGLEIYTKENGEPDLRERILTEEQIKEQLRKLREEECFKIINRGKLWYDSLTEQQLQELRSWYKEWLDITKTKTMPVIPNWLKEN